MVASTVSFTVVMAGVALTTRFSKFPPLAAATAACTVPASTMASSAGAGTVAVPVLAPAAMVIVAPLVSVTSTGVCAGAVRLAV